MNPDSSIEIRDTEHMFYRLDLFQNVLEEHALAQHSKWKSNVRYDKTMVGYGAASKGSNSLLVGISLPMEGENGTANVSMFGLKQSRVIPPAPEFGLKILLPQMVMKMVLMPENWWC